jgi:hypothetical protein
VIGRKVYRSTSIYPDDRESAHYDPNVFARDVEKEAIAHPEAEDAHELVIHHTDDEIIGFLRSMLHEIRAKRQEMVTHQKVDNLLGPLGFAKGGPSSDESSPGRDGHGHRGPHLRDSRPQDDEGGPSTQGDS